MLDGDRSRAVPPLILVRHGEATFNQENRFAGWIDAPLTATGIEEARDAAALIRAAGFRPAVVHTSLLRRSIATAERLLAELKLDWIPVRRSWRLNERMYGALQGVEKRYAAVKFGEEQVRIWRRSFSTTPPPLPRHNALHPIHDPRYAGLAPELIPDTECLADVERRLVPYWQDSIAADLAQGHQTLVVIHGNSFRAFMKHLEGISERDIEAVNVPTATPRIYEFNDHWRLMAAKYLGDPGKIARKENEIGNQSRLQAG
jgi:2,3-bisphosphoglycerate-dependent phosphoglycerate mutase